MIFKIVFITQFEQILFSSYLIAKQKVGDIIDY